MMEEIEEKESKDQKKLLQKKLKALRQERKEIIDKNRKTMKKQNQDVNSLKKALPITSGTVPALSKETGLSSTSVMWYMASLVKYGEVVAGDVEYGYIRYHLAENNES